MSKRPEHREPHTERHEHHIHQEKSRMEWVLEIGIALMVLGTLAATSVAAYWTSWQWSAANDQLGVARDTERQQLRAYVGITQHGIENFGTPTQVLKVTRKNYGVTPAYDLFMDQPNFGVTQANGNFIAAACWPAPPAPVNTLTIFPQQELRFEIRGSPLSKQQIDMIRNGTEYVMIYWGTLHYKDAFGAPRCTRYCWQFKGESMAENDNEFCLQHNDAY
jgi:hypothetical protein